jgi:hypothetical protein
MTYPTKYKPLLKALREGPPISLSDLVDLFAPVRNEIEANRDLGGVTQEEDPKSIRLNYRAARELVSTTVIHHGFVEVGDEVHDSIDDCADLLMDLDELDKLETLQPKEDVWWTYVFNYDYHFGNHMNNIEIQSQWLTNHSTGIVSGKSGPKQSG